ncbi:MAG: hypothetical protein GPJ54_04195 [Candidatus Heimdallarchaeota archaeon]|nr:hypothetical protein [Candidatus Heimdallarchaeota archaeon]
MLKTTVLSRRVVKNVVEATRLFREEIDVGSYGCLKLWIFKNQEYEDVVTVFSDWIDESKFLSFEKSELYNSFKNTLEAEPNIDYEILGFKDSLLYSDETSEFFSISRSYVKNYKETLKMFKEVYNKEEASKLGILSVKLYLVLTNKKLVIALINWRDPDSHNNFTRNKPTPTNESLGEYGTDRYGLMNLIASWSTSKKEIIKEN